MSRNKSAIKMVLHNYAGELWRMRKFSMPALLLPGIGNILVSLAPPLVIAAIIRDFHGKIPASLNELLPYIAVFAGVWLAGEAIWRIGFLFLSRAESQSIKRLYTYALNKLLDKDQAFFNDSFAGSLTKRALGYGKSFEHFFDTLSFSIIANILPLIASAIVLWTFSPWLVLALVGLITITIFLVYPFIKRRQKLTIAREAANTAMAGHVADVIGNMPAVQAFAQENHEHEQHEKLVNNWSKAALTAWDYHTTRIDLIVSPMYVLTNTAGLLLAVLVSKDANTIAAVFVVFSYFGSATRGLFEFNRIYRTIENALTEAAEFTSLLLKNPTIVNAPYAKELIINRGEIKFESVNFSYPDAQGDHLFKNLNLHLLPGQRVALVGRSGGGKTTVTKLLLRFADITSGTISIDSQPINTGTLASLRSAIAYVPQDPAMFHRSIRENIRYGKLDASDKEVADAAKKAHALEFIDKLPQGFDTLVGERGVKLSGGQRQRIAIARAILKNAPILLLDEATSALDSESEKLIQASLKDLMKDRTAIVIAHRLSTIQKMDRIIVLDNGKITEDGTHAELLKSTGIYAKLWAHQSGGFIEE